MSLQAAFSEIVSKTVSEILRSNVSLTSVLSPLWSVEFL